MKIIGNTPDGMLAVLTKGEIAHLIGCDHAGYDEWNAILIANKAAETDYNGKVIGIKIPCELPVHKAWGLMADVRKREEDLCRLADQLRGLADLIGNSWPALTRQFPHTTETDHDANGS